ncbi:MAG: hypothetical protein WC284_14360 [Candidimonas sp.]
MKKLIAIDVDDDRTEDDIKQWYEENHVEMIKSTDGQFVFHDFEKAFKFKMGWTICN